MDYNPSTQNQIKISYYPNKNIVDKTMLDLRDRNKKQKIDSNHMEWESEATNCHSSQFDRSMRHKNYSTNSHLIRRIGLQEVTINNVDKNDPTINKSCTLYQCVRKKLKYFFFLGKSGKELNSRAYKLICYRKGFESFRVAFVKSKSQCDSQRTTTAELEHIATIIWQQVCYCYIVLF